jgi:HPt (histidine-containing phosphotransfer) domain-containing protein
MEHGFDWAYINGEVYMFVPDEMLNRYFERRRRDLEECVHHLKTGNLHFIEKVGHQLKGNGVTFGYPELSVIGKELEAAAQSGHENHISEAMEKLSDWVSDHLS